MDNKRVAIQIIEAQDTVTALCNDGAIFMLKLVISANGACYAWSQLPEIPQPAPALAEVKAESRSRDWVSGYLAAIRGEDGTNPYDVFNEGKFFDDWQQGYEEGKIDNEKRKGR